MVKMILPQHYALCKFHEVGGLNARNQMAFNAFHSLLVTVQRNDMFAAYMPLMRWSILKDQDCELL